MAYLIVFVGAGVGGALRHFMNVFVSHWGGASHVGTAIVNVSGSFAMGLIAGYFALRGHLPQEARLFLTTGVLGGYTTFSTFSLDAVLLYERGQRIAALGYIAASVCLSIIALAAALALVRIFVRLP
jgi:CrcB protein